MSTWTKDAEPPAFKGTTRIGFILDRSGSMRTIKNVTISGFNEWLTEQRKVEGACLFTLTLFDTALNTPIKNVPIERVADLDGKKYDPENGGMTALYDAIALCTRALEADLAEGDRALVVTLTDGHENASKEFGREQIKQMIEEREAKGNWTFTYLSASPTAFEDARRIGTQIGNIAHFDATQEGTSTAFRSASRATSTYRTQAVGQSASFYSGDPGDEDKDSDDAATWTQAPQKP